MIDIENLKELEKAATQKDFFLNKYAGKLFTQIARNEATDADFELLDFLRNHCKEIIEELVASREALKWFKAHRDMIEKINSTEEIMRKLR